MFLFQMENTFERDLRERKGFTIKQMATDGACMFRAVGKDCLDNFLECDSTPQLFTVVLLSYFQYYSILRIYIYF